MKTRRFRRGASRWGILYGLSLLGLLSGLPACESEDRMAPDYYEDRIREFEARDAESPPAPGGVLFVGSSSIRMWSSLAGDMHGFDVQNRGFGGSQLHHLIHNVDRIITPYGSRAIVVYAGDNDLVAGTGKTAEVVLADWRRLVARIRAKLPGARVYFLSIKPSKARWDRWPEMSRANAMIAEDCQGDDRLGYIDVASPLLSPDGRPRDDVFIADGLHLNETGYRAWAAVVRARLVQDLGDPTSMGAPPDMGAMPSPDRRLSELEGIDEEIERRTVRDDARDLSRPSA